MQRRKQAHHQLARREREVMEVVYRLREATAREVQAELLDHPDKSTVRMLLTLLEQKGQLKRRLRGKAYCYRPAISRKQAATTMLQHVLGQFYEGATATAAAHLLNLAGNRLTRAELDRLSDRIQAQIRK